MPASVRQVGSDHPAKLLELGQRLVPAVRRHPVDAPFDACLGHPLDLAGHRLGIHGHWDGSTACRSCHLLELGYAFNGVAAVWHPTIRVADDALEDLRSAAAEQNRRGGGFGRGPPPPPPPAIIHLPAGIRPPPGATRPLGLPPLAARDRPRV